MGALRILHVAPYFENAWAYGGIPRVVSAHVHALAAAGHHVTVATTDARDAKSRTTPAGRTDSSRLAPRAERTADGIDLLVFPNLSNTAAYRWQFYTPRGFAGWLRANARTFDIAHLHACRNLLTARAAPMLRRAGVPFVVQPNGTARRIERRLAAKAVFDMIFGDDLLAHAARIIAVSGSERRQLQEIGYPGLKTRGYMSAVPRGSTGKNASRRYSSCRILSRRCRRAACRNEAGSGNDSASRRRRC